MYIGEKAEWVVRGISKLVKLPGHLVGPMTQDTFKIPSLSLSTKKIGNLSFISFAVLES